VLDDDVDDVGEGLDLRHAQDGVGRESVRE
jgi:hypothetical protein